MSVLTEKDVDDLLEAVEAWKHKDAAGDLVGMIMIGALCKSPEEGAEMKRKMDEKEDRTNKQRRRNERAIMLMAKLIQLRDGIQAEEVASKISGGRAATA